MDIKMQCIKNIKKEESINFKIIILYYHFYIIILLNLKYSQNLIIYIPYQYLIFLKILTLNLFENRFIPIRTL